MRIEIALYPGTNPKRRFAARMQIFAELEYLREACQYWTSLTWTLRMFEVAILRMGLNIERGLSIAPEAPDDMVATTLDRCGGSCPQQDGLPAFSRIETDVDFGDYFDLLDGPNSPGATGERDNFFGVLPVTGNYDWIEDLVTPHHFGR